ncbi:ArdC-like ssDNA-binding domain-containing protein [Blastomonas aquatica]|uniref:N-terminal domain-containing protein n=1 Tax=Blastomonas aquatica TaxID=1510276 RepID=A0ABQ1JGP6_9SPHN|nr:ArdC family protein [Blastomonas aquatica]GGB65970.1 hypothetical protein GCM10010833_21420 [Blastomonas aquatica]
MENTTTRNSPYTEVTQGIIADLEQGRLPSVQPWDTSLCGCTMPHNAATDRRYPGINVLILWAEVVMMGYGSQRWLTYRHDGHSFQATGPIPSKIPSACWCAVISRQSNWHHYIRKNRGKQPF